MSKMKQTLEGAKISKNRFLYRLSHDYASIDTVLIVCAILICIMMTWWSISSISRNWDLEQRLASETKRLELMKLEVDTLELENKYYASEEYQELAAREKQNKLLKGEHLIYLPKNSDDAKNKYKDEENQGNQVEKTNFEQWILLLFGI